MIIEKSDDMYRKTYAVIDGDALENNIKLIKEAYPDYEYYFGVVKANAYGHGVFTVDFLIKGGINYLACATLDEAVKIRKRNKKIPILCLEPVHLDELEVCSKEDITITIHDTEYYYKLVKENYELKIHLKIDSGMNRLGIKNKEDVKKIVDDIDTHDNLYLEGIYTHMATSGENDKEWDNQLERFIYLTSTIDLKKIPIVHMGRSATLIEHPKIPFCNGIRLGIIMYGYVQNKAIRTGFKGKLKQKYVDYLNDKKGISKTISNYDLKLQKPFSLYSEIIQIKDVKKGDYISYGPHYKAPEDMKIGVVAIGHADGVSSANEGRDVLINDKKYPIIGTICMDMLIVKIDDNVKLYDKVTLIGDTISPLYVCNYTHTSPYNLFTMISPRVPRLLKSNGKIIESDEG